MCLGRRYARPPHMPSRLTSHLRLLAVLLLGACRPASTIGHLGRRIGPSPDRTGVGRGTLVVLLEESVTVPPAKVALRPAADSADYLAHPTPEEPPRADRSRRLARYPAGLYQLFVTQPGRSPVAAWVRICAGRTDTLHVRLGEGCDLDCQYAAPADSAVTCGTRRLSSR